MSDIPPSEAVRSAIHLRLKAMSRQSRRDYGGFGTGKRRKLEMVPVTAREVAKKVMEDARLTVAGEAAPAVAVSAVIEQVMMAFPPEDAFHLASHSSEECEPAFEALCRAITIAIMEAFEAETIQKQILMPAAASSPSNGWMYEESIKSHERPSYIWRRTWVGGADNDFIGFDGEVSVGRIFRPGTRPRRNRVEVPGAPRAGLLGRAIK